MRCKWYNEVKGICTNARCAFFNSTCGLGTKQDVCKYAENEPWPVPPKLSVKELVKALRVCTAINNCSVKCPLYDYGDAAVCESAMKQQAANMLEKLAAEKEAKKPENRVLTLEEVAQSEVMWYDDRLRTGALVVIRVFGQCEPDITRLVNHCGYEMRRWNDEYNDFWRCWLRKPTPKEMEATPWES